MNKRTNKSGIVSFFVIKIALPNAAVNSPRCSPFPDCLHKVFTIHKGKLFYVTEDYIVTKYYYSMIEKSNQIEEAIFELVPHTPMALCVLSFLFKNHCLELSRKENVEGYDLKSCGVWSRSIYFTVCLSGCVLQPGIFKNV